MIKVDCINASTIVTDEQVHDVVNALGIQVMRDWEPIWGVPCELFFVPKGQAPDPKHWWLTFLDDSDQADALGYHDLTTEGHTLGKVFVRSTIQSGGKWSVTASHELLEMLGDPDINLSAYVLNEEQTRIYFYAYEVADAVESDQYGYDINGVLVSDFVTPAFFEPFVPASVPLDFKGFVTKSLQILPGGYLSILDPTNGLGWQQLYGAQARLSARYRGKIGSRREKRRTRRSDWRISTVKTK